MDRLKEGVRIVAGVALILAAVWGVTDFTLDARTAELVRAVAALVLALWNRFRPAPGQEQQEGS